MKKLKVLGISGSLRKASYNRMVLQIAKMIARDLGAEVSEADLKEINLPIYDQDIEDNDFPESARKLKKMIESADVLLIATPEYNGSMSGALKNAIDWLSRDGNSLAEKIAAIFGASTSHFGSVLSQMHLREIVERRDVFILPNPRVFIGQADEAFDSDGSFKDKETHEKLKELIEKTLDFSKKHNHK